MGQMREVDAISDAIVATEREIAGEAWDIEETDPADETGDRSLESLGEGLEGQHEAEEDETEPADSEETEDEEESEDGEDEGEDGEGSEEPKGEKKEGEGDKPADQQQTRKPEGRVPSGKLREAQEARRLVEAERDQLKTEIEALKKAPGDNRAELDALKAQVGLLSQQLQGQNRGQQPPAKTEEPKKAPDIFEDPEGFRDYIVGQVKEAVGSIRGDVRKTAVETSFQIAHGKHGVAFDEAMAAVEKLNPQDPNDRATVQRIYNSSNPGEALVGWHNNAKAMREVGGDIAGYRERIAKETREALLKDPEFKKQLIAEMRGEAATGQNGAPRNETRLPKSLNRQSGSNLGSERMDHRASDDSEQAVADAAWR